MAHVDDRWHRRARPSEDPQLCREHRKVPTDRHGRGKRWQATWLEVDPADGKIKERTLTFPDGQKADTDALKTKIESEQLSGQYIDRSDRSTVAEYARKWAASRPHGPRTARRVDSLIRTHIEGTPLGRRPLREVRPSEAQAWATGRSMVLAPLSLRTLVSLLRSVYAAAVADRLVASSPFARLALPSARRVRLVPLTVDQVKILADAVPL